MKGIVKFNIRRPLAVLSAAVMMTACAAALPASAEGIIAQESSVGCPGTKLKTPVITGASKTIDSVVLKWDKVKGASGYMIYKKVGKKYSPVGIVRSGSKVKYRVKKLKRNKKYSFKVAAYKLASGKKCYSKYSKAKTVTTKKYGLGSGKFVSPKYSVKFYDQVWKAESADNYTVTFFCKKDEFSSLTLFYNKDYDLEEDMTAEKLAQQAVDSINEQHTRVHAEMAGADKMGGLDAYRVHVWGDEGSPIDPDYDLYIAYAVKDGRIMEADCHVKNDHYDDYGKIMDNVMKTFKFM